MRHWYSGCLNINNKIKSWRKPYTHDQARLSTRGALMTNISEMRHRQSITLYLITPGYCIQPMYSVIIDHQRAATALP